MEIVGKSLECHVWRPLFARAGLDQFIAELPDVMLDIPDCWYVPFHIENRDVNLKRNDTSSKE